MYLRGQIFQGATPGNDERRTQIRFLSRGLGIGANNIREFKDSFNEGRQVALGAGGDAQAGETRLRKLKEYVIVFFVLLLIHFVHHKEDLFYKGGLFQVFRNGVTLGENPQFSKEGKGKFKLFEGVPLEVQKDNQYIGTSDQVRQPRFHMFLR